MTELCQIGRIFDPAHPTCRTCLIGCAAQCLHLPAPDLQDIGKKHGLPGRKPKKQPKYRNRKVELDGEVFDSEKEFDRWRHLKTLEAVGAIGCLTRQTVFELVPAVVLDGRKKPAIRYIADFTYFNKDTGGNRVFVVEDCKSEITRKLSVYRMKKHMLKAFLSLDILES